MSRVVLITTDWSSGEVEVARSFYQRWRGLKALAPGSALLLRTRSVHGFGMRHPFLAIGLDRSLRVTISRVVKPGQVAWLSGARLVLEMPAGVEPPLDGATLKLRHV